MKPNGWSFSASAQAHVSRFCEAIVSAIQYETRYKETPRGDVYDQRCQVIFNPPKLRVCYLGSACSWYYHSDRDPPGTQVYGSERIRAQASTLRTTLSRLFSLRRDPTTPPQNHPPHSEKKNTEKARRKKGK